MDILLPPRCQGCGGVLETTVPPHLCACCRQGAVPIISPLCPSCGIPFPDYGGGDHLCGECLHSPPAYRFARSAFVYGGVIADLIHDLKYGKKTVRRRVLGELLLERLGETVSRWGADILVPVPLHPSRLRSRGFNQSLLLGEVIAPLLSLPIERSLLLRTRQTPSQTTLSRQQRLTSPKGSFALADPERVRGRSVLLLDDVMTTGGTLNECARVLVRGGAVEVSALTVARTVLEP
ncbi:MAG: ComF family protein [Desulfuromonadia bacterium]